MSETKEQLYRNIHALVLSVAIVIAVVSMGASGALAQAKLVWSLGASDDHISETITLSGPVEIRWRVTGGQFQLSVIDAATNVRLSAGPPQNRKDASASPMVGGIKVGRPGDVKIEIQASGGWLVRAVQN